MCLPSFLFFVELFILPEVNMNNMRWPAPLKAGDKVSLVGFGTFEVRAKAARTGRNPQTGKEISIPASKAPAFKAGKAFKDAIK